MNRDDDLAQLLGSLSQPDPAVPARGAARARRRAGRRHIGTVAAAGLLVAAIVTAVPVGLSLRGQDSSAPAQVASTEPSVAAPQPTAASEPTTEPTAPVPRSSSQPSAPGGVASPSSDVGLAIEATTQGPSRAGDLADFVAMSPVGELDEGGAVSWDLDPCRPTTYPQDVNRVGWYSQAGFIGDGGTSVQVASFATDAQAVDQIEAFARVTNACWGVPGDASAEAIWQSFGASSADFSGVLRYYAEVSDDERQEGVAVRRVAVFTAAERRGRQVTLVTYWSELLGGTVAAAQGDDRPGSGADAMPLPVEEAQAQVEDSVASVRRNASEVAASAAAHVG